MLSNEIKSEISSKINDLREEIARDFAKRSDIPDISGLASKKELAEYAKAKDLPDLNPYLKARLADEKFALKNDIPDLRGFAKSEDIPDVSTYLTSNDISSLETKVKSNRHFYEGGAFLKIIKTNDWRSYPFEHVKTMSIPASENKGRTIAVNLISDWTVTASSQGGDSFQYRISKYHSGKEYAWQEGKMAGIVITHPLIFFDSATENQEVSYKLYVKPSGTYLHAKGRLELCVM